MRAYRIVDWKKLYELTAKGYPAKEDTPMDELRKSPFPYIRIVGKGHMLDPARRRMYKKAWLYGDNMDLKCWGLYTHLLDLARDQDREYRGWILDDRQRPINPAQIADVLGIQDANIIQMFEILTCSEVSWVELVDFPESLQIDVEEKQDVKVGNSQSHRENLGESGNSQNPFLNRNETEEQQEQQPKPKPKAIPGESGNSRGLREPPGEGTGSGENFQPQARPAARTSDSDSTPASVPDSASEKPTISDSVSAPVSTSSSGPRAGPGADGPGHLSEQQKFDISRACNKAALELARIIRPCNKSDVTTINDIFSQLQQRLISGCREPLFEMALNTAKQCLWADYPIAMFVAAMKKSPFCYVPKSRTDAMSENPDRDYSKTEGI